MAKRQIATRDLFVGIHRAHRRGDVVPAENVEPNGWTDDVANEGTKAATDAVEGRDDWEVGQPAAAATTTSSTASSGGSSSR